MSELYKMPSARRTEALEHETERLRHVLEVAYLELLRASTPHGIRCDEEQKDFLLHYLETALDE